jgi:hypothetical protein
MVWRVICHQSGPFGLLGAARSAPARGHRS